MKGGLPLGFRIRIRIALNQLESIDVRIVLDEVVRVLAELIDADFLSNITVGCGSLVHAHLIQVLELLDAHVDLLLWDLSDAAIIVFEEKAIHLHHFFLNFEKLNQVDVLLFTILVLDFLLLRHDYVIPFLSTCDDPL